MAKTNNNAVKTKDPWSIFENHARRPKTSIPIWLVPIQYGNGDDSPLLVERDEQGERWLKSAGFKAQAGQHMLVPGPDGELKGVAFALGGENTGRPCGPGELLIGEIARKLPVGSYHFALQPKDPELATIAWGLGAYQFDRYKAEKKSDQPKLEIPKSVDQESIIHIIKAIWLGRDLINTPASDLGPAELEAAARNLAKEHGAQITTITGDALLDKNFPMIHAVGRASPRQPRLIDLRWQCEGSGSNAPTITLVGKGISFDTGGLDLKPASNMILMKKDMGGAASTLALGQMIMGCKLDVRLRILIAAAENSVSGNAFRPSDILDSRSGLTVEVGNTDAEGRLVLADALSYADEQKPDVLISLATLTGAARVALGTDLPAFFCTDDGLSKSVMETGVKIGDPLWRMPFWSGYERTLKSPTADISNISNGPFAGAITAALFLKRFVANAHIYAHVDMYGWRPSNHPLGPKGGEAHAARTLFAAIQELSRN